MHVEKRMWRIDGDEPRPVSTATAPAATELQALLRRDPSLLGERLLVIGSQVATASGVPLDVLAVDADGGLHVVELAGDAAGHEVVARALDHGSWAAGLSREDVLALATRHLAQPFEAAFEDVFGGTPPDELNHDVHLIVVAGEPEAHLDRIARYLRPFGVPLSVVFLSSFEDDGRRYLTRSWLGDDDEPTEPGRVGKRAPWNGRDWYVSFGGDRLWEDARTHQFVSAGTGASAAAALRSLPVGARVWINIPGSGYVAVGTTLAEASPADEAKVLVGGAWVPLADQPRSGGFRRSEIDGDDAEWVVPVTWLDALPEDEAFWRKGMFTSQRAVSKLRQEFTLRLLEAHFNYGD